MLRASVQSTASQPKIVPDSSKTPAMSGSAFVSGSVPTRPRLVVAPRPRRRAPAPDERRRRDVRLRRRRPGCAAAARGCSNRPAGDDPGGPSDLEGVRRAVGDGGQRRAVAWIWLSSPAPRTGGRRAPMKCARVRVRHLSQSEGRHSRWSGLWQASGSATRPRRASRASRGGLRHTPSPRQPPPSPSRP